MSDKTDQIHKRQWGSETNMKPLPWLHEKPSIRKLTLSRVAIFLTIFFWVTYIFSIIIRQLIDTHQGYNSTMEALVYSIVVTFLTFSALIYLIARLGALERFSKHVRVPHSIMERHFSKKQSAITVLIPSYDEEPEVIRKTILSAALQDYPNMRIVLLIDDNPYPSDPAALDKLNATRNITGEISKILAVPNKRFTKALENFNKAVTKRSVGSKKVVLELAEHYKWAVKFLNDLAAKEKNIDHVDNFFIEQVLRDLGNDLHLVAKALNKSIEEDAHLSDERIQLLFEQLVWIFNCKLDYFERKKYASLTQEPNKAMNLNAYIGLMGGIYHPEQTPDGLLLIPVNQKKVGDLEIKDSEFLLTLDADSILLRDYCMRLVYFLQQPDNERIAVTQTPYSSFRGAFTRIERLSAATTDIQHILHQGMSRFGASFWVGANAVIRKKALEDIIENEWIGGFEVKRYIQDRTVIEDTESSVDLAVHGWGIMNYPERLSYSATPPDFGSLIIQRRRWANGGLLILPKLWSLLQHRGKNKKGSVSVLELLLRANYMTSIAWASFGLLFLLAYPFNGQLLSPLILLSALPYFIAMAVDLKYCRYSYLDIFSIYGFNLILLPVNLAGVLKSIEQALTGKKIPFARTPKVKDRTSASLIYVIFPVGIVIFSLYILWLNFNAANWGNAIFAGFNAVAATWAIISYIGITNLFYDIWLGINNWFYVENKTNNTANISSVNPGLDWKAVLYSGENSGLVPHTSLNKLVLDTFTVNKNH